MTPATLAVRLPANHPKRPLPPRIKVSYPKAMTIAAGFLGRDGILLCTDSQYTGSEKSYRPKILSEICNFQRRVTFALSGDEDYAKSAITDAFQDVDVLPEEASIWDIRRSIRRAVSRMDMAYRKHQPNGQMAPQFLVAITNPKENFLFSSREAAMPRVETYECLGSGSYLGRFIASLFSSTEFMPLWAILPIAIQMIAAAKKHDPYCGGGSHFVTVRNTGLRGYYFFDPILSDALFSHFEQLSSSLLSSMTHVSLSDEEFQARLTSFTEQAMALRAVMQHPNSTYRRLITDLNLIEPPHPQSTTTDPSPPQP